MVVSQTRFIAATTVAEVRAGVEDDQESDWPRPVRVGRERLGDRYGVGDAGPTLCPEMSSSTAFRPTKLSRLVNRPQRRTPPSSSGRLRGRSAGLHLAALRARRWPQSVRTLVV